MARTALTVSSLAVLTALAACGDRVENTEMPQTPQANVEINRQGMEGAKEEQAAIGVEHDTNTMGAARSGSSADPDERIAADVKTSLASNPDFGALEIDVRSEDGKVTLRGRAPDPAARDRASEIARSVDGVKSVENQLTLG
ncbi:MAG TPA: BON domain-containing protein [Ramlibacter sp.]